MSLGKVYHSFPLTTSNLVMGAYNFGGKPVSMLTAKELDSLPCEIKTLKRWVLWKRVPVPKEPGKFSKPPCNERGYCVDGTTPKDHHTLEEALKAHQTSRGKTDGIGFAFTEEGLSGIDVDDCIDQNGNLTPEARAIVDRVDSYTELSPSGAGLHILVKGTIPEKYRKPPTPEQTKRGETIGHLGGKRGALEAYSSGRYFTVTGHVIEGRGAIQERQTELTWFWETYVKPQPKPTPAATPVKKAGTLNLDLSGAGDRPQLRGLPTTPTEVITLIGNCGNSEKFRRLMAGDLTDHGGDNSRADLALCSLLAFYCGKDPALIEGTFNLSELAKRDKWKRGDYRNTTISKAIELTGKVFEPTAGMGPASRGLPSVAKGQEPDEWQKIICFLEKITLPKFPSNCLPDSLRAYVESVAECRKVPVDLPAMLALAVAAAAGARKYRVYIGESHTEPLNLFTVSALPPGSRKTDTYEDMVKPLYIEQIRRAQGMKPVIEEAKALQKIHEKRMEYLLTLAAKEINQEKREELEHEYAEMGQGGVKVPAYPQLIVSGDTTPEAIAGILEEQGGKIAIMDTEGGLFSIIAGRYDGKGEPNMDVWLKMHAGDELSINRRNRPPIEVSKPAGTIALTVQPAVIKDLASKKDFQDRGLLGRFLYSLPESLIGTRFYQNKRADPAAKGAYLEAIRRIFEQPDPKPESENDRAPHYKLFIRGAALEVWTEFYNDTEKRQAVGGDLAGITDWASKSASAIARIAGIFHVIETGGNPDQDEISVETMGKAYEIGRLYLIEHAKAAYGLMNMTEDTHLARCILAWISTKGRETFTANDFWIDNRSKAERGDDLLPGFELLEERGIIRELPEMQTGGRKAKHRYELNPSCKACFRCMKGAEA